MQVDCVTGGAAWFHDRLKKAFIKNKDEKDPQKVERMLQHGEFVVKVR